MTKKQKEPDNCFTPTEETITQVAIHQKGTNPLFGNSVAHIGPEDEAAGSFLSIKIMYPTESEKIAIDWEMWDRIVETVAKYRKNWEWED